MYLAMAVMAVAFAPFVLLDGERAFQAVHLYCRYVRRSAELILGLRTEVRGEVPHDEVLVAAKHQSFLDIILIVSALPRPKFIMKKELLWAPFLGWYATRIGCVPVDRGKRGAAVEQMLRDVEAGRQQAGPAHHLPAGDPCRARVERCPTRSGPRFSTSSSASPAFRRRRMSGSSGLAVASSGTPASPWWSSCRASRPACRRTSSWRGLEAEVEAASDRLIAEAGFARKDAGR